jgi:hypothetical protein
VSPKAVCIRGLLLFKKYCVCRKIRAGLVKVFRFSHEQKVVRVNQGFYDKSSELTGVSIKWKVLFSNAGNRMKRMEKTSAHV